jgi:hypothetical protein
MSRMPDQIWEDLGCFVMLVKAEAGIGRLVLSTSDRTAAQPHSQSPCPTGGP